MEWPGENIILLFHITPKMAARHPPIGLIVAAMERARLQAEMRSTDVSIAIDIAPHDQVALEGAPRPLVDLNRQGEKRKRALQQVVPL